MADNTKLQYIIELLTQGDTSKARDEFAKLDKSAAAATTGVGGLTKGFASLFAVLGGLSLVHQSVEAFLEQERAVAKLDAALRAIGEFTPELSKQMQGLAESLSKVSLFGDEAILNVIAKLTAAGAKSKDIERLTKTVLDLATLMDKDLNRVTQTFSQALLGEVSALKGLGATLDETKSAQDQFNDAQEQFEKRAGGQREAVKGVSADYIQLKKDIDDAKKAAGSFFLTAYSSLRRAALDMMGKDIDNSPSMAQLAGTGPKPVLTPESNAALMKLMGIGAISSPGLSAEDEKRRLEELRKLDESRAKSAESMAVAQREVQESMEKQAAKETIDKLVSAEKERHRLAELLVVDMKQLAAVGIQDFAGGFAHAIVGAFEEGDKAFQKFASNFLRQISEMILRTLILRAISSFLGAASSSANVSGPVGDFNSGAGVANLAASGGQFLKRFASGGMADLNGATYFPKFNVLAGEAGREVMTVLAQPRLVNFNGLSAQVGMAGGNRLAITSADALASRSGGGAGGQVVIEVRVSPGSEARIIKSSLENVIINMQQQSTLSNSVKNLTR